MNHELNAQVAERVMGLGSENIARNTHYHFPGEMGRYCGRYGYSVLLDIPDYSGSLDAAWQMEEEIERQGLHGSFVRELVWAAADSAGDFNLQSPYALWLLIHATPEQRCEAALEAVREK